MNTDDEEELLLVTNQQWGLFDADPINLQAGQALVKYLVLLWLPEETPSNLLLAACEKLNSDPPNWPGTTLTFESEPSPGFCLEISREWWSDSENQQEELFRKMMWEIERAKGNV